MSDPRPLRFAKLSRAVRQFLFERDYIEFQTPVLRKWSAGQYRPRIRVPEYGWLRESAAFALRVNLAHWPRIFELGPMFRPDISDRTHLSEFSMLDLYNSEMTIDEAEALALEIVRLFYQGHTRTVSFATTVRDDYGIDLLTRFEAVAEMMMLLRRDYGLDKSELELLDAYICARIEPMSLGACVVVNQFPATTEVRARSSTSHPWMIERFEILLDGVEVVHGYADEPDGEKLEERARFAGCLEGEDIHMAQLLRDRAVPAISSGFGIGLERLCQACEPGSAIWDFVGGSSFSNCE